MKPDVVFGATYRHKIHPSIEGIAVAQSTFMTGCDRVCIQSVDKDGDIKDAWFDLTVLDVQIDAVDQKPGACASDPS